MYTVPPIVRLRFRLGAVQTRTFTWKAGGSAVNLTGWTARMEVRDAAGTLAYALSTSPGVGEGTITLGGVAGTVQFGPFCGPLQVGSYDTDMRLTAPGGEVGYFFRGTLLIDERVTQ